jgi:hypothetical protein
VVFLLGLEQEWFGEGIEIEVEVVLQRRSVTVPQAFAAGLGKSKEKKGDQHQREGVGPDNATDLSWEKRGIPKRTGRSWRAFLGRRSGGVVEDQRAS